MRVLECQHQRADSTARGPQQRTPFVRWNRAVTALDEGHDVLQHHTLENLEAGGVAGCDEAGELIDANENERPEAAFGRIVIGLPPQSRGHVAVASERIEDGYRSPVPPYSGGVSITIVRLRLRTALAIVCFSVAPSAPAAISGQATMKIRLALRPPMRTCHPHFLRRSVLRCMCLPALNQAVE